MCLPVDWVGKVPVGSHEEPAALGYVSCLAVDIQGILAVLLPDPEAVGALLLVEDVGLELVAVVLPHICSCRIVRSNCGTSRNTLLSHHHLSKSHTQVGIPSAARHTQN